MPELQTRRNRCASPSPECYYHAMRHPLLPERPLCISPALAATVGLEEAVLLTALSDLLPFLPQQPHGGRDWYTAEGEQLYLLVPFWQAADIQRVATSLRNQGALLLGAAPFGSSEILKFALPTEQNRPAPAPQVPANRSANTIAPNWQPDAETLLRIGQLGIPEHFVREQLPEFVTYWRERGESRHSFGALFLRQVKGKWETFRATAQRKRALPDSWQPNSDTLRKLADEGVPSTFVNRALQRFLDYHRSSGKQSISWDLEFNDWVMEDWEKQETPFIEKRKPTAMCRDWQPSEHTWEQLQRLAINPRFCAELLPEFIYQWLERGGHSARWGELFIEYAREEWAYYCQGIDKNPVAKPIARNWQPGDDCLNHLVNQCEIERDFALSLVAEFIIYWRGQNAARKSWDAVFVRHARHQWAERNKLAIGDSYGKRQDPHNSANQRTRDRPIGDILTDTNW
ncbi:DnaT-like ssDNA-binding domain-containing protein [Microbulbifer sp. 2205BS26-8]|uniref:DnaT-like ssDNA-binding domain-containing protein n=1 Tax=Microbulbifer sp. 2205BS26-8 TaxID=3064386 RepID=UPI00273D3BFE|nr:DnaT-like ssDNA-binding domain-containing protein [Microbulbifer sp. 2205BS26-8]MDP5208592.1 DnaT-like ssDNA-binding domain-containing protein [Microbulbifer sp. 2205BS26-8]